MWIHTANRAGKWYRGILEAAERFMTRWPLEEENKSSERRAARMRDAQSRKGGGGGGIPLLKKARRRRGSKAPGRLVGIRPVLLFYAVPSKATAATIPCLLFMFFFYIFGSPARLYSSGRQGVSRYNCGTILKKIQIRSSCEIEHK